MKLSYSIQYFILIVISNLCLAGCKKAIEIDAPSQLIVTETVFNNDKTATAAVAGIYSEMMRPRYFFASGAMTLYPGLSADEIVSTFPNTTRDAFKDNNLLASNNTVRNDIWRFGYSFIYRANACIEGITQSDGISVGVKQQLLGEAKFVRAFCHFYLANLFGDIPLVTTTDYRVTASLPRESIEVVYKGIANDLKEAASMLSSTYVTSGRVRPNKWAAKALLARTYLYERDWAGAESEASQVIASGKYNLVSNLNDVFLAGSDEAIWQLAPVINGASNNTHEGFLFVPFNASSIPAISLSSYLINSFEPNDKRKVFWIGKNTIGGQDYYFPYKYKVASNYPSAALEYNMVLRLAEQYLIRAEARVMLNNIPGAQDDINVIRNRAGLANTTATSKEDLIKAVDQERRTELFVEWGHRWFDLKRTSKANVVLGPEKGVNWQATDVLYPIPLEEILINANLTQNPGY